MKEGNEMRLYRLIRTLKKEHTFEYWNKGHRHRLYFDIYPKAVSYIELSIESNIVVKYVPKCFYTGDRDVSKKWKRNYLEPVRIQLLEITDEIDEMIYMERVNKLSEKKSLDNKLKKECRKA